MSRVMYIECHSGAAGDMLLGALLDAGLPLAELEGALGSLQIGHELLVSRVIRGGITATKVDVRAQDGQAGGIGLRAPDAQGPPGGEPSHGVGHPHSHGTHSHGHDHAKRADGSADASETGHGHGGTDDALSHRTLSEIERLIRSSGLSASAQRKAISLFERLGEVEATIHSIPVDEVHLHEVGALDSIIDIVGLVFAFDWFGITEVVVSPLNVGGGTVEAAHGRLPVPAPATLALLKGVPIYSAGPDVELVTPTGALVLSHFATAFGPMPAMAPEHIGYGAGTRNFEERPNVLRVVIGDRSAATAATDTVVKIECEIDDMSPQIFAPATDRLFKAGALDVFVTAIQMKKGRPGHLVTVLAPPAQRAAICRTIFEETTTIGVRFESMRRETLDRRWETVTVGGAEIRIKVAGRNGQTFNVSPEFDDCLRAAERSGRPVREVQADALKAWWERAR